MIHNVMNTTVAPGGTEQGRVTVGRMNGLVIGTDTQAGFSDTEELIVTYRGGKSEVLVNGIGLKTLAGISDLMGGWSQSHRDALMEGTHGLQINRSTINGIFIPLGSIHLTDGIEVEVQVRNRGASASRLNVASYYNEAEVETLYQYHLSSDTKDTFRNVERLFLVDLDPDTETTMDEMDSNILTVTDHGSTMCRFRDVAAYTASLCNIEASGPNLVWELYRSPDGLASDVGVQITGPDASLFGLIAMSHVFDVERVSKSTINSAKEIATRMDRMPAEKAKVLRRMGRAVKPSILREVADKANLGTKDKDKRSLGIDRG